MGSTIHVTDDATRKQEIDVALRFQETSRAADAAAKAAPVGRRSSAYAKVMSENGFKQLDMTEVRRLVGE